METTYWPGYWHVANEVLDFVTEGERLAAHQDLRTKFPHPFLPLGPKRKNRSLQFLAASTAERLEQMARLDEGQRYALWCTARYLALVSAKVAQLSQDVSKTMNGPDREAVSRVAAIAADQSAWSLTAWEICHLRLPDQTAQQEAGSKRAN